MNRKLQIAVVGNGNLNLPDEISQMAEEVGTLLAQGGATVVCGGLEGVMAAVARGAATVGGLTVGILPTYDAATANPSITVTVASGMGHGRNMLVAASGDVVIALPGGYGTMSEVAFALTLGKPVIGLRAWNEVPGVREAQTPAEAVALALAAAQKVV